MAAWLTQTQGESSPPSFHGVNGNSRKDQGRENLEEMMLHSLQPGAIAWDELLACPVSLEEKLLVPSLTHSCTSCRVYI